MKKYIKLILIFLVITGLTGSVTYQFFLNQNFFDDKIIKEVMNDENDILMEQMLNQFAEYGKNKKYDDAILMLSDTVGEELRNMKQVDFDSFLHNLLNMED